MPSPALADDVEEIAHRDVDVHEMQSPIRQDLSIRDKVTVNVVDAPAGWAGVYGYFKIGCVCICFAFGGQKTGESDPWRVSMERSELTHELSLALPVIVRPFVEK